MTPVGVFFICQNEDKCHFVNSTKVSQSRENRGAVKHRSPEGQSSTTAESLSSKSDSGPHKAA